MSLRAPRPRLLSLRRVGAVAGAVSVVWVGCGGSRPPPATRCADPEVVGYPPPPAQVERLEQPPDPRCQWLDGTWEWIGRRWQWKEGAWVIPPPGCALVAPIMVWLPAEGSGVLYYRGASYCPNTKEESARRCATPKPCPSGDAGTVEDAG